MPIIWPADWCTPTLNKLIHIQIRCNNLSTFAGGLLISVLEVEEEDKLQSAAGHVKEGRGGQPGPAGAGRPLQTAQTLHSPPSGPGEGE